MHLLDSNGPDQQQGFALFFKVDAYDGFTPLFDDFLMILLVLKPPALMQHRQQNWGKGSSQNHDDSDPVYEEPPPRHAVWGLPVHLYQSVDGVAVNANGKILGRANDVVSPDAIASLRTIKDLTPISVKLGQTVLLASDVAFMQTVFSELERADMKAQTAVLPQGAGELHIELQDKTYKVKFSLLGDARQQVGALIATVQSLGDAVPQEYVDVRLSERVFVK